MDITQIVTAIGTHNWLLLVMLGAVYARTLFSDKSRFPWTWTPNWLPVFSGAAGAVIVADAALMGGKSWGPAVLLGVVGFVSGGFLDGMASACFGGDPAKVPTWAKFLTGLIDDVFGGKGVSVKKTETQTQTTEVTVKQTPAANDTPDPPKGPTT